VRIYQVDAFAERIFEGNPAGVCILEGPVDEAWMQNVAMEMNLSETSFLHRTHGGFNLRWFTSEAEVDLCGHATLASAHILWETGILKPAEEAVFFTKSGRLFANRQGGFITLDFPAKPDEPAENPSELLAALGIQALYVGRNDMDFIVELEDEATVRAVEPDMAAIVRAGARGVIVTARATASGFDFVSRFFAPAVGIPEDPVTGSAHCCLGPYWKRKLGKSVFFAYQASKRGGKLKVEVKGDRVLIGGKAITVFSADLR
jgi:PhzF family phenazine biosynthesis protein